MSMLSHTQPGDVIQIVSDNVDLCLLMKAYFLQKRCTVHIAHLPDDGLQSIREKKPLFVFVDPDYESIFPEYTTAVLEAHPEVQSIYCGKAVIYPQPAPFIATPSGGSRLWHFFRDLFQRKKK